MLRLSPKGEATSLMSPGPFQLSHMPPYVCDLQAEIWGTAISVPYIWTGWRWERRRRKLMTYYIQVYLYESRGKYTNSTVCISAVSRVASAASIIPSSPPEPASPWSSPELGSRPKAVFPKGLKPLVVLPIWTASFLFTTGHGVTGGGGCREPLISRGPRCDSAVNTPGGPQKPSALGIPRCHPTQPKAQGPARPGRGHMGNRRWGIFWWVPNSSPADPIGARLEPRCSRG